MWHEQDFLSPVLNWPEIVLFATFAAIGGTLGYLMRQVSRDAKPKPYRAMVEGIAGAFVGILTMLMCKAMGFNWMWSAVIVGAFSWLGAEATIVVLVKQIRGRLGLDTAKFDDSGSPPDVNNQR